MSFASLVHRARTDFTSAPRLELTMPQAVRLWGLGVDDCRFVVDALVDAGFLRWTPRRTIVRATRRRAIGRRTRSHIHVRSIPEHDKAVGRE